jgi:DNA-directed RNA polymerase specialized sigma24 family protein
LKKTVRLPTNPNIAAAIIERFKDRIIGASYNIGRRYQLHPEDREELISHVHMKIARTDWRRVFRANMRWIIKNYPRHRVTWTAEEIAGGRVFNGYVYTTIQKSMLDEVRRIKCVGFSGMGLHKLDTIRPLDDYGFDQFREESESSDFETREPSADGIVDRSAAAQIAKMAKESLSPEEWKVCSLSFGFDGGSSRTPTQVAREAQMPRKLVQSLLDSALSKMRLRVDQ